MEIFIAAILCGLFVGLCSGLLGVGGGTLMVPLFRLAFGMPALTATATSLFTIIPTSVTGFVTHIRNRTCVPKLGIAAGIGGAVMSPVGVQLSELSPSWLVMLTAALIMGYTAFTMFKKALAAPVEEGGLVAKVRSALVRGKEEASSAEERATKRQRQREEMAALTPELSGKQLMQGAIIGLFAGLASGYVGVGGGFLMVPLFITLLGISMKQASGTSLVAIMILAIPGVVTQGMLGNIDYLAGLAMACGSIPGAALGADLARFVPERRLRFFFAGFLVVGAIMLAANEILGLG